VGSPLGEVQLVPDVLDRQRILADHQRRQAAVDQLGHDRRRQRVMGLAVADDPVLGFDSDDDGVFLDRGAHAEGHGAVAQVDREGDGADRDDLHDTYLTGCGDSALSSSVSTAR
jgi:hypothetical protein